MRIAVGINGRRGFTLFELAIVLTIVALVTAMGMSASIGMLESSKRTQTENKLNAIEAALASFRMVNSRLPCPSDPTVAINSTYYGTEATSGTGCYGEGAQLVAGGGHHVPSVLGPINNVVEGAVPVKALNLPNEYMMDGWGHRINYAVDNRLTAAGIFKQTGLWEKCGIVVGDGNSGTRSAGAIYSLISFGSNGHGAYPANGGRSRISAVSVNPDELTNCHCDTNAADTPFTGTYVLKDATEDVNNVHDNFDDILRVRERWQLQTADDAHMLGAGTCNYGTQIRGVDDGGGMSGNFSIAVGDVNGDGIPDLIIGAPHENSHAGYIYVVYGSPSGFPNPLPLANLNGTNGFRIDGIAANDQAGSALATGDVNGDGIADILIGAGGVNSAAGSVYVIYGSTAAQPISQSLSTLNGTNGFHIDGIAPGDNIGNAVATGDVNGDGIADIIIGAPSVNGYTGDTYIVFGTTSPAALSMNLSTLNHVNGFHITGAAAGNGLGFAVTTGDINGDGIADIITTAPNFNGYAGAVYVIFGNKTRSSASMNVSVLDGTNGFRVDGALGADVLGWSVATGDVNEDGISDLVIGAAADIWNSNQEEGQVYTLFGHTAAWPATMNVSTFNGTNGFRFYGTRAFEQAGRSVATGDVNGDGISDIIIGAPSFANTEGRTYVVFGTQTIGAASTSLSTLNGTKGFLISGAHANDFTGAAVATAPLAATKSADIITSSFTWNNSTGRFYIIYGHSIWPPVTTLPDSAP